MAGFYSSATICTNVTLEKVYENALALELRSQGIITDQQKPIQVIYKGHLVGEYFADLVVADLVLVEIKAARLIAKDHEAQTLNYLKATKYEVGLLLNFGPKPQIKRFVYENEKKQHREVDTADDYKKHKINK